MHQARNAVKTFGGRSTNSEKTEKKVRSKKKPSYLRKHGYNIFDNYFMTAMKQRKIQMLQMTRTKKKICQMMKS